MYINLVLLFICEKFIYFSSPLLRGIVGREEFGAELYVSTFFSKFLLRLIRVLNNTQYFRFSPWTHDTAK